jgi:outer membrane protein TolC
MSIPPLLVRCTLHLAIWLLAVEHTRAGADGLGRELAAAPADPPKKTRTQRLTLDEFLAGVAANNLDLAAQRYNISIAQAQVVAAKVSPNPVFAGSFQADISHRDQAKVYSEGFTEEIEVGGKRKFRVSVAQKNLLSVSATVDDFFRTLRGTAATAFVTALAGQLTVDEKRRAFEALDNLAKANEKRLSEGDLGEADADQARLAAKQAEGDLVVAQSAQSANLFALVQLLGKRAAAVPNPSGSLIFPNRDYLVIDSGGSDAESSGCKVGPFCAGGGAVFGKAGKGESAAGPDDRRRGRGDR